LLILQQQRGDKRMAESQGGPLPKTNISVRDYLSMDHICSAAFFARKVHEIEERYNKSPKPKQNPTDRQLYEHTAYAINSIFAARAYLEAVINHVFLDAVQYADGNVPHDSIVASLTPEIVRNMATAWGSGVDSSKFGNRVAFLVSRSSTNKGKTIFKSSVERWGPAENKYQCALVLAGKEPFDGTEGELKSVCVLRMLRNELVHHKPTWITYDLGEELYRSEGFHLDKLANELKIQLTKYYVTKYGKDPNSINPNPIKNQLDPYSIHFPRGYLGATCAAWGIKSSMDFTEKFFSNMEIDWLKLKDPHFKKVCRSLTRFDK